MQISGDWDTFSRDTASISTCVGVSLAFLGNLLKNESVWRQMGMVVRLVGRLPFQGHGLTLPISHWLFPRAAFSPAARGVQCPTPQHPQASQYCCLIWSTLWLSLRWETPAKQWTNACCCPWFRAVSLLYHLPLYCSVLGVWGLQPWRGCSQVLITAA